MRCRALQSIKGLHSDFTKKYKTPCFIDRIRKSVENKKNLPEDLSPWEVFLCSILRPVRFAFFNKSSHAFPGLTRGKALEKAIPLNRLSFGEIVFHPAINDVFGN